MALRKYFSLLLTATLSLSAVSASSVDELTEILTSIDQFKADFYQQVLDDRDSIIQEAKGSLSLKKPGMFRWYYDAPISQQLVADGKNLWMFDLDLAQVTVQPISQALGSAPIMLLMENTSLSDDFEIRAMPAAFGLEWIALAPKIQDTEFLRIEIGLDGHYIREMKLYDQFDQKTVIRFSNIDTSSHLEDVDFKFYIPSGVDVIGEPN